MVTMQAFKSTAINSTEENLRMLINNTDEAIWLVDTDYTIIECNNAFRKWIYSFIGHELGIGDNVLFDGRDKIYHDKFGMCYRLALQGSSFRTVEDMYIGKEIRYTAVTFYPVYNAGNEITGVSCFARDITDQRNYLHKIEHQNRALRDIAFMESHKLRGPLANIIGIHDLFNDNDPADPANRMLMAAIGTMSRELDLIVREVVRKSNEV